MLSYIKKLNLLLSPVEYGTTIYIDSLIRKSLETRVYFCEI